MNLFYIDSPEEKASLCILKQLDVAVNFSSSPSAKKGNGQFIEKDLLLEHKSSTVMTYSVIEGQLYVDLRDCADCWIRVILSEGNTISLPASIYRRITTPSSVSITEQTGNSSAARNIIHRYTEEPDSVTLSTYHTYRELVCELCRQFFVAGWVTGTGGSISIRHGNRIYMTPSGVQKERIQPDELYVLDLDGEILATPIRKPGCRAPKLSDCSPLFLHAFKQRNAGAVLHSHSICTNLATSLFEGKSEFRISHQEMIKGIAGYGYFDELVIPIIENTAWEHELADSLGETIAKYPKACAVLVRRHGMYVWGDSWEQAKRHGECLHYLFEVAISMRKLGMDFNSPPVPIESNSMEIDSTNHQKKRSLEISSSSQHDGFKKPNSGNKYKYVLFDIEGTTTPITFVKDVLFPYAHLNVQKYLETTWTSSQTKGDTEKLKNQSDLDTHDSSLQNIPLVTVTSNKDATIKSLVEYVQWNIAKDRKISALKDLQGHIWESGYNSGEIQSVLYDDVPLYFSRIVESGSKVAIYSSGSREAQRLLFKHSNHGDLRSYISCYFDTKIGQKRESGSYTEISQSLGVDHPSEILFVTDIFEEAKAADEAGMHTVLSIRPGNAPLSTNNSFATVTSFDTL